MSIRKCPICEGLKAEVLHTQSFVLPEGHPQSDGYDVVCCVRCGFVFADTAATEEDYDRYYAQFSKYEDSKTSTGAGDTPWDARRLTDTARQIAGFLPDRRWRILDIGCANGGLLKCLRELGFENLYGIDPSPVCVANTRILGFEAYTGSLSQLPDNLEQFNCVVLSHVLEHVPKLKQAVQSIYALLTGGGHLCGSPRCFALRRLPIFSVSGLQHRAHQPLLSFEYGELAAGCGLYHYRTRPENNRVGSEYALPGFVQCLAQRQTADLGWRF